MYFHISYFSPVLLTAVVGILIFLGFNFITSLKFRYESRRILQKDWKPAPYHWFWGHAQVLIQGLKNPETLIEYGKYLSKEFPHGSTIYQGPFTVYLRICHPDVLKAILGGSEKNCPKSRYLYDSMLPWLGKGLLLLEGLEWHRHRRLLTNSFHWEILRPYCLKINGCCHVFVENLKEKCKNVAPASIDIFESFSLLTLDALMQSLMAYRTNCQKDSSVHSSYVSRIHTLSRSIVNRYRGWNFLERWNITLPLTNEGKLFYENCKEAREYAEKVIEIRRKEYASGVKVVGDLGYNKKNQRHCDFLDILLHSTDANGNHLTGKEISDEVNTFIFEGHDTTTSAMSWACYAFAMHPEYQEKCFQEILEVKGDKKNIEWDDLSKLEYLTLCIKESMRMYPPVPTIMRKPTIDIEVNGRLIKAGTTLVISILGVHYNPLFWKDAETFNPLRFTKENSKNRHPYAYVPFSAGIRNCIGQNFAMNEIKVCLSHLLYNFKLSIDESKKIVPSLEVVYRARGGMHLFLKPRKM